MIDTKQLAFNLFEQTRSEFLAHCRWVASRIAREQGHVTVDDIRDQVQLPKNIDGRVFGAVLSSREFVKVGETHTRRKTSHQRPIAVFTLAQAGFKQSSQLSQSGRPSPAYHW